MLDGIGCLFGRHKPSRRKVWNDGLDFRSSCAGCGKLMLRDLHGWRLFDPENDFDLAREGKPSHPVA